LPLRLDEARRGGMRDRAADGRDVGENDAEDVCLDDTARETA
jgi:hypothetical protein